MIVVVTLIILIAFVARLFLATNAHKKGENIYEIEIIRYRSTETYLTKSYKFDENRCVTFTDELGREKTICGEVNITKY